MKKDKTYKLEIETIEDLKKLKNENEVSFDKLFKMLIKLFKKNETL